MEGVVGKFVLLDKFYFEDAPFHTDFLLDTLVNMTPSEQLCQNLPHRQESGTI